VPLLLCFAVFWFLVILPEKKKQKARQAMIREVKKGDQVVTTSGILGKVMKVEDQEIVLQVDRDNDVRIHFQKSAVHEVIPEGTAAAKDLPPAPPKEGGK
jgi:preprotein translocase subunit YajC